MPKPIYIRPLFKNDWPDVARIYREGIDTNMATFETSVPNWKRWKKRHLINSTLVAQLREDVVGFATLALVSKRKVYNGVASVSVYVSASHQRQGIGEALLKSLVKMSVDNGFWTLQASVFPNNSASIALHEKCGFRIVGNREKIGHINGTWHDNLLLERRSQQID